MIALHSVTKPGSYSVGHAFKVPELELYKGGLNVSSSSPQTSWYQSRGSLRVASLSINSSTTCHTPLMWIARNLFNSSLSIAPRNYSNARGDWKDKNTKRNINLLLENYSGKKPAFTFFFISKLTNHKKIPRQIVNKKNLESPCQQINQVKGNQLIKQGDGQYEQ